MGLGTNSPTKKNSGTMGLGPVALCQLLSSQNIRLLGALLREINDVLWIVPLQRTQKFPCSDSIRILRRCVEIPGNSLSPHHFSSSKDKGRSVVLSRWRILEGRGEDTFNKCELEGASLAG